MQTYLDPAAVDWSAGQHVKGSVVDDTTFVAITNFNTLKVFMRDPADLQPNSRRMGSDAAELEEEAAIHELIQRALTGSKRSNVPPYAKYIKQIVTRKRVGVLPAMHVWSPDPLTVIPVGQHVYLRIPTGQHFRRSTVRPNSPPIFSCAAAPLACRRSCSSTGCTR